MTSGLGRLYAVLIAVVAFFVVWAAVAAHPWRQTARDPRLAALDERRALLRREAVHTRQVLSRRYAAYRVAFGKRQRAIAKARAEQARLDTLAAAARAQYLASAPVRTVTVTTQAPPAAAGPTAAPAPTTRLVAATPVAAPSPVPASVPAPTPAPPPPPPVVSIPPVATTQPS